MIKSIEELKALLVVCEEPESTSEQSLQGYYSTLNKACLDCEEWLKAHVEELPLYYCNVVCPSNNVVVSNVNDTRTLEMIHLPFGSFSYDVWQLLLEHKNNPIFELLRFFEFQAKGIRNILAMHDVSSDVILTQELLDEHDVLDVFQLHAYEHIYKDVFTYIG